MDDNPSPYGSHPERAVFQAERRISPPPDHQRVRGRPQLNFLARLNCAGLIGRIQSTVR